MKDLSGQRFGRLIVVSFHSRERWPSGSYAYRWNVVCDCGGTKLVLGTNLRNGVTGSCGCNERAPDQSRLAPGEETWVGRLYASYKRKALRYNQEFLLSLNECKKLFSEDCFYCGDKPGVRRLSYRQSGGEYECNGIDRVDSSAGYTTGNSVSCCSTCNRMKMDLSQEMFIDHIHKIAKNHAC